MLFRSEGIAGAAAEGDPGVQKQIDEQTEGHDTALTGIDGRDSGQPKFHSRRGHGHPSSRSGERRPGGVPPATPFRLLVPDGRLDHGQEGGWNVPRQYALVFLGMVGREPEQSVFGHLADFLGARDSQFATPQYFGHGFLPG